MKHQRISNMKSCQLNGNSHVVAANGRRLMKSSESNENMAGETTRRREENMKYQWRNSSAEK
jgi:hypothetical protein